jgi:glycosyltransferase involved in cell wall biosynthesis
MNVLFYYESVGLGGAQTYILNIIRNFPQDDNVYFAYNNSGELKGQFKSASKEIFDLNIIFKPGEYIRKPWKMIFIIARLTKLIKKHNIDVIVSNSGIGSLMCGIASRLLGIKHYRQIVCSLVQVEPTLYKHYNLIKIDKFIDGYFGWQGVFDELRAKKIKEEKLIDTPFAVNIDMFYQYPLAKQLALRRELEILPDELVIGWVGRVAENMQISNTIEMCKLLIDKKFLNFKLLIIGGGDWFDEMCIKIDKYGLRENTLILGWQPMEKVVDFYNVMDVVPLLEEDPQGGSILREAMAAGKVVLSVDGKSGTQSSWVNNVNGILVSPDNYLESASDVCVNLYFDIDLRKRIGEAGILYASEYLSFKKIVALMLSVFKKP